MLLSPRMNETYFACILSIAAAACGYYSRGRDYREYLYWHSRLLGMLTSEL